MAWNFNLYSKGFISYTFDKYVPKNASKNCIEKLKAAFESIKVHHRHNDLDSLATYNKHVVYQCYKNVFNSSHDCYGVNANGKI